MGWLYLSVEIPTIALKQALLSGTWRPEIASGVITLTLCY